MKYIDIGVNIFDKQFSGKVEEIAIDAKNNDIAMIITGSSMKSSTLASDYIAGKKNIFSTAGIHPHAARTCSENTITELRKLIVNNPGIVAVGECGLDYDRMFSPKDVQKKYFEYQIILAEELDKPLFLHERAAAEDFYHILSRHKNICNRSVVHCFTGDASTVMKYLDLGCYIGITGWICDERRNHDLLEALKYIPIERLMIETDAPYLTPRNINGLSRTNIPSNIKYILSEIAKHKNMEEELLGVEIYKNTKAFFKL